MNMLESPSLMRKVPRRVPSLRSVTRPLPDIWSYSQAPSQVKETPVLMGLQFEGVQNFVYGQRCLNAFSGYAAFEVDGELE